ncbi:hypothetical protein [Moorena bouillonii]|uniref:hypothetical protein n=1 Tax=Moorena bouillonii TaxID=207920 RepID=UPI000A5DA2D0|nr:hypothetical protein [Moorena bouillonii]
MASKSENFFLCDPALVAQASTLWHQFLLPIPDSRFPIPDSRLPIPDSRFPIPYSPLCREV